ncbi:MAG TPA: DUF1501 domain-containing protein [Polyangia bacterium]|nr:DUF1501 domain-containing protein [Polyangia bacterium]
MNRRDFLRWAGLAGVALMSPLGRGSARAAPRYDGPYFLLVHASGGWDPTYLCDPKGGAINRLYAEGQYGTAGNLKYAPIDYKDAQGNVIYSNQQFFTKYQDRLLVINGVDTATANHDTGTRVMWSGRVSEGYPTFAAVVAAARVPGNPLGFISSGGYETTAGLVPLTRLGNVDAVRRVAYPNRLDPNRADYTVHSDAIWARIQQAQRERLMRSAGMQTLPVLARAQSQLFVSRAEDDSLSQLASLLPTQSQVNAIPNPLYRQAVVALAGFQAGVAVAANLSVGGFDTHGNHDTTHLPRLSDLLIGVDLIMDEIANRGLDGKVVVVVGSDFGRTPRYNAQNGKDHWNITSMMMMGPGIPGGRVIGGTDDEFRALNVNSRTLAPDVNGVRIGCAEVQRALRKLAGIDTSAPAASYPVGGADLPLFA